MHAPKFTIFTDKYLCRPEQCRPINIVPYYCFCLERDRCQSIFRIRKQPLPMLQEHVVATRPRKLSIRDSSLYTFFLFLLQQLRRFIFLCTTENCTILNSKPFCPSGFPVAPQNSLLPIRIPCCPSGFPVAHQDSLLPLRIPCCPSRFPVAPHDSLLPLTILCCSSGFPVAPLRILCCSVFIFKSWSLWFCAITPCNYIPLVQKLSKK